jgi:hypothetical protein
VHVVPVLSQQPEAQDFASQTHLPCGLHSWVPPHATHATPPVPHVPFVDVWQLLDASQQPPGHVFASQTHLPCAHSWFAPQTRHTLPLAPHCWFDATSHRPLAQQPPQLRPPHEHAPPVHASPSSHEPHALPPEPQTAADWAGWVTQLPSWAQQPPGHDALVHPHAPVAWLHVCPGPHVVHALPPVPQAVADCEA